MRLLFVSICVLFTLASAESFLSNALGSHMVLQRAPQRANLWGWTQAGTTVSVVFNSKTYTSRAATDGSWNVFLDATAAGGPYKISVTSSRGESAVLEDVLFGDVWVCGGQSNMQFTVASAFNATAEIAAAANYPNIRVYTVGQKTTSPTPLKELQTVSQPWVVASPQSIGAGNWSEFSAVCWFFGRDLYDELKVPLGLFSDNWGGTIVQAWSSPEALSKCNVSVQVEAPPNDKSDLWNAMIVPILPMTITGAIWYQGESNEPQPDYYACAFPEMINDWRLKWGGETNKEFPFYFVQLAPWLGDNAGEAKIRLAQMYATKLPNVGVATAMDWGDPTSPWQSVHPRYKQIVGQRLSLVALGMNYKKSVQYEGPEFAGWRVNSPAPNVLVQVTFTPQSIGSGLTLQPKKCDPTVPPAQCSTFEIGLDNGHWVTATASLQGNVLYLQANVATGLQVTGVRYAWSTYPVATLYNRNGLPALPFAVPNPIKPYTL